MRNLWRTLLHHLILTPTEACEWIGHNTHWTTPHTRTCQRCKQTWHHRPDTEPIGQTTTTDPTGQW